MNKLKYWTADFLEFRKKIESMFGNLEELAKESPDIFSHQVLSHGFMEYAGIKEIYGKTQTIVAGSQDKFHSVIQGQNTLEKQDYQKRYDTLLKTEYLEWARKNNLPEHLLEQGWQEFLED